MALTKDVSMKTLLILTMLMSSSVFAADLTVKVTNLKSTKGEIFIALWDSARGFPSNNDSAIERVIVEPEVAQATIKNLKPGKYAIAIFHDKNSDRVLNTNAMGIPKEAFGFSNNPRLLFGPPKFRKASFTIKNQNITKTIRLKYF